MLVHNNYIYGNFTTLAHGIHACTCLYTCMCHAAVHVHIHGARPYVMYEAVCMEYWNVLMGVGERESGIFVSLLCLGCQPY